MVKLVKNNMKQNIHSLLYKNLKKVTTMIKQQDTLYMIMIKYYMNNRLMKNKDSVRITWLHLSYHIVKE